MKRFKDILNEFRMNEPPSNRDRGGGDPVNEVYEFMKSVPFEHKTADENTMHFYDSHDAASRILENREKHDRGWGYAMTRGSSIHPTVLQQRGMPDGNYFYFASSLGSHDNAMRELYDHIHNHPQLPSHLKEHIPEAFERLENRAKDRIDSLEKFGGIAAPKGQSANMGELTFQRHAHMSTGDHPHQDDTAHHFQNIVRSMKEDPDIGFFLHKDEM